MPTVILSVLLSPEAKILQKTKNFSKSGNVSLCGDVSKCPRDHFQRSISTRSRDIDKNKKMFENMATNHRAVTFNNVSLCGDVSRCPRDHFYSPIFSKGENIDEKQKRNFWKSDHVTSCADRKIDEKKKIFENLTIVSRSPGAKILTKNAKEIFENLTTSDIDKNKKEIFENLTTKDIDKKQKKIFENLTTRRY
ncbi:hypothetical protein PUN28_020386 [Cardiocondyla obscurior]|uniref:Uncharacterized protein n=1 Tax=Cardiocondyla obscurior TaxID=286306 RepID=A0AAW2E867_9HYME